MIIHAILVTDGKDYEIHKDSPAKHQEALKMGSNMIQYVVDGWE